jgi:hypothetical protein
MARQRLYRNPAEKQAAYRERLRAKAGFNRARAYRGFKKLDAEMRELAQSGEGYKARFAAQVLGASVLETALRVWFYVELCDLPEDFDGCAVENNDWRMALADEDFREHLASHVAFNFLTFLNVLGSGLDLMSVGGWREEF